jgi:hypothetical protein
MISGDHGLVEDDVSQPQLPLVRSMLLSVRAPIPLSPVAESSRDMAKIGMASYMFPNHALRTRAALLTRVMMLA